jgi:transcriptional regulator with XRE-family HTH domain
MSIGLRIKDKRIKLGLNQSQLAEAVGVNQVTISKYESGKIESPPSYVLFKMAVFLETTPEYLLFGTRQRNVHEVAGALKKLITVCRGLSSADITKLIAAAKALHK